MRLFDEKNGKSIRQNAKRTEIGILFSLQRTNAQPVTEQELISRCQQEDRQAQRALYDRFAPVMFSVCRRYIQVYEDAEDVLAEAFYKVFTNIGQYKGEGSLEGWVRRIVVNEALMFLRKNHALRHAVEIDPRMEMADEITVVDELAAREILELLDQLPTGYRTVFNLYVLEGFKHREIADALNISINTSKSQLILAKKRLQELLAKAGYGDVALLSDNPETR